MNVNISNLIYLSIIAMSPFKLTMQQVRVVLLAVDNGMGAL
jgi:hypothetical protein